MSPAHTSDESIEDNVDFGENVDTGTFEQILDMDDDDEDRDFSKGIVFGFLEQAEQTFEKMDEALVNEDLPELSSLGHFLKGSSATLGFTKVKDECEKIQHYGHKKDETGTVDEPDAKKCLRLIAESLAEAKRTYFEVAALMKRFFGENYGEN